MRVSMAARHMEMTDALKGHVEKRLEKVKTHFDKVIDVDIVLSVEKHRHIAEITLHSNGVRIHGKEASDDMYASVDLVVDKIDKQILKFKDRSHKVHLREDRKNTFIQREVDAANAVPEPVEEPAPPKPVVVRETLNMKPMSVDEAQLQLKLSGDRFLAFSNSQTNQVNVLYVKDDGTLGLIEPHY
ncbi:MAG: ribosomal subunit interface protein [Candidatus Hydrogenedentota bacterium]